MPTFHNAAAVLLAAPALRGHVLAATQFGFDDVMLPSRSHLLFETLLLLRERGSVWGQDRAVQQPAPPRDPTRHPK